jgi:hypothetical protein
MTGFVVFKSADSVVEILWDIALATLITHLALIYFLLTLTSSLALYYITCSAHLLPGSPVIVLAAAVLAATAASARFVVTRYEVPRAAGMRLAMGAIALALMVAAQMLAGAILYGGGWIVDIGSRAGLVSAGLLVAYALMPVLVMVFEEQAVVDGM